MCWPRRQLAFLFIGLVVAGGCEWKKVPPAKVAQKAASSAAKPVATANTTKKVEEAAVKTDAKDVKAAPADVDANASVQPTTPSLPPDSNSKDDDPGPLQQSVDEVSPAEPPSPERLVVLTNEGPLLVDLILMLNGQPHAQQVDVLLDKLVEIADTDHDRAVTWNELTTSDHFEFGQYGNPAIQSERQRTELISSYDINRNERVERDEWFGFLRQDPAKQNAFTFEKGAAGEALETSALFQWLDQNSDGKLDRDEIERSSTRIKLNDTDDDGLMTVQDFAPLPRLPRGDSRTAIYGRPGIAILLRDHFDWSRKLYLIEECYAAGNPLSEDDIPGFSDLVRALDTDSDGQVSPAEFKGIAHVPPHLVLKAAFVDAGKPSIEVVSVDERRVRDASADAGVLRCSAGGSALVFAVIDQALPPESNDAQADQLLMRADQDKDGKISPEEYTAVQDSLRLPFESFDHNPDGRIERSEILGAALRRQMVPSQLITGRVRSADDRAFLFLDEDEDGRLTIREIKSSASRLAMLDVNGDDQIQTAEFPVPIAFEIVRGTPVAQIPPVVSQTSNDNEPRGWFEATDVNGDGEVSRLEFLGPIAAFESLDQDQDGFISKTEAAR
jgi:Ca2+-binding EF-hand superfamily protein